MAKRSAVVAVCDIRDTDALRDVFRTGRRAFLLNPPADPSTDTDAEERATVASIVAALDGSGLEKVVAQSTYGARPGERCGDLTVLYELEQALAIPASVLRAAYYMTNWDAVLPTMRNESVLPTLFPAWQLAISGCRASAEVNRLPCAALRFKSRGRQGFLHETDCQRAIPRGRS